MTDYRRSNSIVSGMICQTLALYSLPWPDGVYVAAGRVFGEFSIRAIRHGFELNDIWFVAEWNSHVFATRLNRVPRHWSMIFVAQDWPRFRRRYPPSIIDVKPLRSTVPPVLNVPLRKFFLRRLLSVLLQELFLRPYVDVSLSHNEAWDYRSVSRE